jgi:hypothetical protein
MNKIEALVDAIGSVHQAFSNPDSQAYKLRSPIMVRSFARPGKHESDTTGHRVFTSMLAGYRAAVFDLELKVGGKSRAGLDPESPLVGLLGALEITKDAEVSKVVAFLQRALTDPSISKTTQLMYFSQG